MDSVAKSMLNGLDAFLTRGSSAGSGVGPDHSRQRTGPVTGKRKEIKPDEPVNHSFFEEAMRESLGGFARVTAQHLQAIEEKVARGSSRLDDHEERLKKLETGFAEAAGSGNSANVEEIKTELASVKAEQAKLKESAPHTTMAIPFEQRTIARIGNLGWNTPDSEILERARIVLTEAGVGPSEYCGLTAPRRSGSIAELCFNDPSKLQRAKLMVSSIRTRAICVVRCQEIES